ncbi:AraC family transcriptional regulator [Winogradskyella sp. PE311]|uniref:AraC family transcriptional regulator n=1 Tax=Winogradskyella sp. PE311 TaxID=3366943 RepID=UPI003980A218
MSKSLPKITFKSRIELDIEVMTLSETYQKLKGIDDHDPFKAHKIQFYFIVVVSKGSYKHYVDFQFYNLNEGSVLFIAKNQVHHFTENMKHAEGFCIVLNSVFFEQHYFLSKNVNLNRLYNYHLESPVIHKEDLGEDNFVGVAHTLYNEYHFDNNFLKGDMLRALLQVFLLKAERAKENKAINSAKIHWLETFSDFKNMLQTDYIITRSSRAYASKLFISYKLLNDILKELTGKTVKSFIDDFVTMEIKRYLVSTSLSIKEVSYKTGFEEPANMIKFFKKNTQKTPLQFRSQF